MSAHTVIMQTTKAARRGYTLATILILTAILIGIIRWATNHITLDGTALLVYVFAGAGIAVYAKVAGVAAMQRHRTAADNGHLATVTPITAAGRHDAA